MSGGDLGRKGVHFLRDQRSVGALHGGGAHIGPGFDLRQGGRLGDRDLRVRCELHPDLLAVPRLHGEHVALETGDRATDALRGLSERGETD